MSMPGDDMGGDPGIMAPTLGGPAVLLGEGDWICPDPECANMNFARRAACNRCGRDKPVDNQKKKLVGIEIGKMAAEKSKGLFSADDWQCTKCGNVNWARRSSCNVCNAPKFKEVEERTGYGGGYNERGVVEYIEREESDDEYDEFGRKKKKFRNIQKGESQTDYDRKKREAEKEYTDDDDKTGDRKDEDDKEDDEEEDDDEDGDLSKYDLSDWGTETAETTDSTDKAEISGKSKFSEKDPLPNTDQPSVKPLQKDAPTLKTRNSSSSRSKSTSSSPPRSKRSRSRSPSPHRDRSKERRRRRSRTRSTDRDRKSRKHKSKSRERKRSNSPSISRNHRRDRKYRSKSRSKSRDRHRRRR